MDTMLMMAIMGLVCQVKAPGGGFGNLKFDQLYKNNLYNIFTRLAISRTSNVTLGFRQN